MRTMYLVNNTSETYDAPYLIAYSALEPAIAAVEQSILTEDHFVNLSKKDRVEAALDWIVEIEVA